MKLIWHIVLKDLARLRRWVALWVALYVLQLSLGFSLLYGDGADLDRPIWLQLGSAALILLQVVTGLIAVCVLVHEDRLIGTDVTWRTRPVAPARLLAAKLTGAALWFGLLPVVLMVPWWLACGLGWSELWLASLAALGWQVLIIVPAFWLASLTDTVGRFLLWLLVGLIALITVILNLSVGPAASAQAAELGQARTVVAIVIVLVTGAGVTALQFLTRRRTASVVVSLVGLAAAVLALAFWPWTLADRAFLPPPAAPIASVATEAIKVGLEHAEIPLRFSRDSKTGLALMYRLEGLPENAGLLGLQVQHEWRWPDGQELRRMGRFQVDWSSATGLPADLRPSLALREPPRDEETDRWLATLRSRAQVRPSLEPRHQGRLTDWLSVPSSLAQRMLKDAPAYRGVIHVALTRAELLNEQGIDDRSRHVFQAQTLRVTQVAPGAKDTLVLNAIVTVPVWETNSRQSLRRWLGTLRFDPASSPHTMTPVDTPFLISRSTGEIRELIGQGRSSVQVCGVTISWAKLKALQPKVRRGDRWVVRYENWFAGTSLAVVRAREVARIVREVGVKSFELSSEPEPRDGLFAE